MPRAPKQQPAQPADLNLNDEAFKHDGAILAERAAQLAPIDEKYGGVAPYQKDRVEAEAAFFINQGSESFFEAGKRLILLKEHEQHGEFIKALGRIGVDPRAAQRLMAVAARFADMKTLGALPRSKLLELAVLEDEDLSELDKGGTASGLTFDDVDRMGVRELRAALREERDGRASDNAANEKLLEKKDKKLNELARRPIEAWSDEVIEVLNEAHTLSLGASDCLGKMKALAERAISIQLEHHEEQHAQRRELAERLHNDIAVIYGRLAELQGFVYEEFAEHVGESKATYLLQEPKVFNGKKAGAK